MQKKSDKKHHEEEILESCSLKSSSKIDDERHDAGSGYGVVDAGGGPGVQDLLLTFQSFCSNQEVRENIIDGKQDLEQETFCEII